MTTHQWTVQETFYFPAEYGAFTEATECKVTPGFTEERTEDAILLQGIYHIAANVVFDEDKPVVESVDERLVIEDVEVQNGKGYFEYAVPLHVDLPPEHDGVLELHVKDVVATAEDGGVCLKWTVHLQEVKTQEEVIAAEPVVEEKVILESTSHMEFLANADRAVENVQSEKEDFLLYIATLDDDVTRKIFHSNNVFVETES
ncbi:hypothetical protein DV702_06010 [Sporosarcina sp. PTS2304]|uniref:hypothetical protein n=1 Tax=Sporosarcina sp. PTS2304 TaxID=2283194 RepID=UPI000E0DCBFC|nr:hypothetical protein [Sporosarcina sp. PTS2304]AXH99335.1 hypothetical protein DV702_06010 [Sporosarcina sp. PTS2304]